MDNFLTLFKARLMYEYCKEIKPNHKEFTVRPSLLEISGVLNTLLYLFLKWKHLWAALSKKKKRQRNLYTAKQAHGFLISLYLKTGTNKLVRLAIKGSQWRPCQLTSRQSESGKTRFEVITGDHRQSPGWCGRAWRNQAWGSAGRARSRCKEPGDEHKERVGGGGHFIWKNKQYSSARSGRTWLPRNYVFIEHILFTLHA